MTNQVIINRAVVEQALKLHEAQLANENYDYDGCFQHWDEHITLEALVDAYRAALAEQPAEQEPVAWRVRRNDGQYELYFVKASAERAAECYIKRPQVEPLYTAPQPHREVEFTDEEIDRALDAANVPELPDGYESVELEIARAVIEAYKAKQEKT